MVVIIGEKLTKTTFLLKNKDARTLTTLYTVVDK